MTKTFLSKLTRSNYFALLTSNITGLALGLVNTVIASRMLGPDGRGQVDGILLWPILLVYLASLGLPDATAFFAASKPDDSNAIFTNAILISLVQTLIVIPLAFFLLPIFLATQPQEVVDFSRVFLITIPFTILSRHAMSMLRAHQQFTSFSIMQLVLPVGTTIGLIGLVLTHRLTVETFALITFVLYIISAIVPFVLVYYYRIVTRTTIDGVIARQMVKYGLKAFMGGIAQLTNLRLDEVVLAAFVTPKLLGLYNVAVGVAEVSGILQPTFGPVIFTRVAQGSNRAGKVKIFTESFRLFWLSNLALKFAYSFAIIIGIPLLYGTDFSSSIAPALVLLLASVFRDGASIVGGAIQALNRPGIASVAQTISALATVVLLLVLLPLLGIMGAAITSLIAYALSFLVLLYYLRRNYQVGLRPLLFSTKGVFPRLHALLRRS